MSDQIQLFDMCQEKKPKSGAPDEKEVLFLDSIFPTLQDAAQRKGVPVELLTRKSTAVQSASKSMGYTVVAYNGFTAFRLRMRGKQFYISLPTLFSDLIQEDYPTKTVKSDESYVRVLIDQDHTIESYSSFLVAVTEAAIDRLPKEWDCCSRYNECSDAKTCVHPDKVFALGCGYRKILNSGRIFYGKNRNID